MSGFSSMNEMSQSEYDGFLLGTVKFNNDPERLQRIKVSIPRLMDGDVENLPWVSPILSAPQGLTSNAGVVEVPALGALVVVKFQGGQIYYGLCHGSIPTKSYTPNPSLLLNYPNRRGWSDTAGNLMWIDVTSGQTEFHLKHTSGTYVHIDNLGNLHINSVKQVLVDCETAVVNATNSTTLTCPSNTINGNLSLNGNLTHTGNTTQTGNVTLSGTFSVTGSSFRHNGVRVGDDHNHTNVRFGTDISGPPQVP
jgi:hypothetical protein